MKKFSRALTITLCVSLMLCLVLALFLVGEHIGKDHDHDCCPLCAALGLVSAVCVLLAFRLRSQRVLDKPMATTPRTPSAFVLSCVRLNC